MERTALLRLQPDLVIVQEAAPVDISFRSMSGPAER